MQLGPLCPTLQREALHHRSSFSRRSQRCSAFRVTPYKLKKGESLEDIASRRGIELQELLALNHELDPEKLDAGQRILVPQGKLSPKDKQVLDNMKARRYRTYPMKRHENIEDVISSRNIERAEVDALNPDLDLSDLDDHEIIKLPVHKYSPYEQHELRGTFGAQRFLAPGSFFANTVIISVLAIGLYCFWLYRQSKQAKATAELDAKISASKKKYKVPNDLPQPSYMASIDEERNEPLCPSETDSN